MAINSYPDNSGGEVNFPDQLIDPVSKFRVSNPENLIDTDFEYGLQPTKWETVELINNTPSFFSKSGDTTIDGISSIITNADTREIIVKTELDHGLAVGIPINVTGTKSITADGAYIINSIPDTKTFTYLCKDNQTDTNSILDLYSSIITGEFFQGSQLRISDSDGIITDAEGTSTLTVTTNTTHGFGSNTPFYFLNLNSTVAQEFQAANTASKSFDASNSATAQTFDGSNSLSSVNIDWSNSATFGGTPSTISGTDQVADTITVTHQAGENFNNLPLGTALYYSVSATGGYFNTNPRGVVFLKTINTLGTSTSTFQVSLVPDGDAIDLTSNLTGTFQIANQARTFAGNNINPLTQTSINVEVGPAFNFDGGNQGYTGEVVAENPPDNNLTVNSYDGTAINAEGSSASDHYVGSMVRYTSTGTAATGLTANTTYFITSFTNNGLGNYTFSVAALPGGTPISIPVGSGSGFQAFSKIGISIDKDIVHIPNSNFSEGDMLEYSFPVDGRFDVEEVEQEKLFYFIDTAYDTHNYKLGEDIGFKPIVATGGTVLPDFVDKGRTWRAHVFTTVGTSNFVVSDPGKETQAEFLVVGGGGAGGYNSGGGGGGGAVILASTEVTAQTYTVTVGAGGAKRNVNDAYSLTISRGGIGGSSSVFGTTATGGGGGGVYQGLTGSAGANGGGTGSSDTGVVTNGISGVAPTLPSGVTGFVFAGNTGGPNNATPYQGGGGAGAGFSSFNRNGGDGVLSSIDGNNFFYGGGGGGGSWEIPPGNGGLGGSGGGGTRINIAGFAGAGGRTIGANGTVGENRSDSGGNAGANTGGGGGGGTFWSENAGGGVRAGNGGSGIVIIRYPLTAEEELVPAVATGGVVSEIIESGIIYRVHSFNTVGTSSFVVSSPGSWNTFDTLILGGGGGGAKNYAGGGGAGGLVIRNRIQLASQTYSIVVGAGGVGSTSTAVAPAQSGGNSSAFGLVALGGGGGNVAGPGVAGGSGGGGSYSSAAGGAATQPGSASGGFGNSGGQGGPGDGSNRAYWGGGGGGSLSAGLSGPNGGFGGDGRSSSITGQAIIYGTGGGGGQYNLSAKVFNTGGSNNIYGNNGGFGSEQAGDANTPNRGSGGGGAGGVGNGQEGVARAGNGSSGVVIVRYPIGISVPGEYIIASGGEVSTVVDTGVRYAVHQFKNVGTASFSVASISEDSSRNNIEYFIVAGGGGGGAHVGGGGGAGGILTGTTAVSPTTYTVVVGDGAVSRTGGNIRGANGQNSSAFGQVAIGGGGGGTIITPESTDGIAGGSGGGAGGGNNGSQQLGTGAGGAGTAGQGFKGGNVNLSRPGDNTSAAGGGGAGGAALDRTPNTSTTDRRDGGPGISINWTGSTVFFGGGGGSGSFRAVAAGNGGAGGGGGGTSYEGPAGLGNTQSLVPAGNGGTGNNVVAGNGAPNSGGGGGGAGGGSGQAATSRGGSGIVIIRYPIGTV